MSDGMRRWGGQWAFLDSRGDNPCGYVVCARGGHRHDVTQGVKTANRLTDPTTKRLKGLGH